MPGTCPDCVINLAASVDFPGSALPNLYAVNVLCPSILSEWFPDRRPLVSAGPDANDQLVEVSSELGPYRSFRAALKDCRQ
jgi:hypothetical protein